MRGQVHGGVLHPANLGLFTYSYNNPVVLSDPDGRYARITQEGNRINIVIPAYFGNETGVKNSKEMFQKQVTQWKAEIEKTWSGKFGNLEVRTTVQEMTYKQALDEPEGVNIIRVVGPRKQGSPEALGVTPGWVITNNDERVTKAKQEGQSILRLESPEGTVPHEIGHLLGLHDNESMLHDRADPFNIMTQLGEGRVETAKPYKAQFERMVREHGLPPEGIRR